MKIKVSDYIIRRLSLEPVKHIFLLPGGGCMYLIDAIARQDKLTPITLLHEQSVGIAAESYAQYGNQLGIALVTTGPGATNAITPCAAAWTDSTAMIFISGQVKSSDSADQYGVRQLGFQEVPIVEMVSPITKRAIKLQDPSEIVDELERMLFECRSGRPGPVWLDIPLDIQNSDIDIEDIHQFTSRENEQFQTSEDSLVIQNIIDSLRVAEKPCILIGNGVRLSGQLNQMKQICTLLKIPTLLSWKMIDFLDESDINNAGRPGAIPQPWSNLIQQKCDLLIAFGARIDTGQSAYNLTGFAKQAKKIIIDVDEAELKKFPRENFNLIQADLSIVLPQLLVDLKEQVTTMPVWNEWLHEVKELRNGFAGVFDFQSSTRGQLSLYEFIDCLSDSLPRDALVVPGSSGACSEVVMQAFKVKLGQRIFNSEGLGPMGFGIPAAIGAFLASGGKQVISIDGDGGFLMNLQELASAKKHADHIVFFVLNNNGYASIKATQDRLFDGRRLGTDPLTGLALVDLKKVASAFDLNYRQIDSSVDLKYSINEILKTSSSTLVEVLVDENHKTLPRVKSIRDKTGNPLPSNMEIMDFPQNWGQS